MKSHVNIPQNKSDSSDKVSFREKNYFAARGDGLSAEKLKSETDFKSYLNMLWGFAQRYCVIVAAKGTPCGPSYTREISEAFMNIGFKSDLRGKDFCPYAAMIDSDRIIFEGLPSNTKKALEGSASLDTGDKITVFSAGDEALDVTRGLIAINGTEYSPNGRGLNFVVYDKVTKTVIDAVCFDTGDNLAALRTDDYAKRFKDYCQSHPGVTVLGFDIMHFPLKHPTPTEQVIFQNDLDWYKLMENPQDYQFVLSKYFDSDSILQVLEIPTSYRDLYGVIRYHDKRSKYVNIIDGHRVTAYQPERSANNINIYICGTCLSFGLGTDDRRTVASYLQLMFNNKMPNSNVIVHNHGHFLANRDETDEVLRLMESLPVKEGDIILWNTDNYIISRAGVPMIDIFDFAESPHDVDLFFDLYHYTPDGHRVVAEKLFYELINREVINNNGSAEGKAQVNQGNYGFTGSLSKELEEYKNILKSYYNEMFTPVIGAVVMNCNPFTSGHRYLIEKALEQCDFLVIFAVEEDKSEFPFEDRLRLIDEGVKDLSNVAVIPSGKFMISSLTFSEYFNKSEMQDRTVDTSLDVTVFAREIAPCLHIAKRFAGSEPFDSVTRQYNDTMRQVLPEYGIEFIEIPRAEINGEAISASKVRQMLFDGNLEGIKQLVPETTFKYLSDLCENGKAVSSGNKNE